MSKKSCGNRRVGIGFGSSGLYVERCECHTPSDSLHLATVAVEYPPILITLLEAEEWKRILAAKNGRIKTSLITHNYSEVLKTLCPHPVLASKDAAEAMLVYHEAVRYIVLLVDALSRWDQYELFATDDGRHTIMVPRLSPDAAKHVANISRVLSTSTTTRRFAGIKRDSKPRKKTQDLAVEAAQLFHGRHQRIRAAAKDYTKHKRSPAWTKHIALEDKKRPGSPKIPGEMIKQLALSPPRDIALDWTAQELNRRHENLGATSHTVRSLLKAAINPDTKNA